MRVNLVFFFWMTEGEAHTGQFMSEHTYVHINWYRYYWRTDNNSYISCVCNVSWVGTVRMYVCTYMCVCVVCVLVCECAHSSISSPDWTHSGSYLLTFRLTHGSIGGNPEKEEDDEGNTERHSTCIAKNYSRLYCIQHECMSCTQSRLDLTRLKTLPPLYGTFLHLPHLKVYRYVAS